MSRAKVDAHAEINPLILAFKEQWACASVRFVWRWWAQSRREMGVRSGQPMMTVSGPKRHSTK